MSTLEPHQPSLSISKLSYPIRQVQKQQQTSYYSGIGPDSNIYDYDHGHNPKAAALNTGNWSRAFKTYLVPAYLSLLFILPPSPLQPRNSSPTSRASQ
jgi:hypothetical protein